MIQPIRCRLQIHLAFLLSANSLSAIGQSAPVTKTCGVTAATILTGRGLGALVVGTPLDRLRAVCDVIEDTVRNDAEGEPARHVSVRIGADTIRTVVVQDQLQLIEVTSRRFRTRDSLGVGTTVRAMRLHGATIVGFGEGEFFLGLVRDCSLSFRLARMPRPPARTWDRLSPGELIDKVLIVGC